MSLLSRIFTRRPANAARCLIIVERQSPDWRALANGAFHDIDAFERFLIREPGTLLRMFQFWNDQAGQGFYEVRAAMKDVTDLNLSHVLNARRIPLADFVAPFDPSAIYVFIDDDDWFTPDLAQKLLMSPAGTSDAVVWRSARFDGTVQLRDQDGFCYTNNYGVHGRYLNRNPQAAARVGQHMGAQDELHKPGVDLYVSQELWSVTNKHPCSTLTLERAMNENNGLETLLGRYRDFLATGPTSHQQGLRETGWAVPYMRMVSEIFAGKIGQG